MKKIFFVMAVFSCAHINPALASQSNILNSETIIREVVATNPGEETIVPYLTINAAHTSITVRFDVYPVASTTKLFSTNSHAFTLPFVASPCDAMETELKLSSSSPMGGNVEIMGLSINRFCGQEQSEFVLLYGSDVTKAAGVKWGKIIDNYWMENMELVNSDADTDYEILAILDSEDSSNGAKYRHDLINAKTGVTEVGNMIRTVKSSAFAGYEW